MESWFAGLALRFGAVAGPMGAHCVSSKQAANNAEKYGEKSMNAKESHDGLLPVRHVIETFFISAGSIALLAIGTE